MSPEQPPTTGACSDAGAESLEELRAAPPQQDDDGNPIWPAADPSRPVGKGNPPRGRRLWELGAHAPPPLLGGRSGSAVPWEDCRRIQLT